VKQELKDEIFHLAKSHGMDSSSIFAKKFDTDSAPIDMPTNKIFILDLWQFYTPNDDWLIAALIHEFARIKNSDSSHTTTTSG